VLSRTGNLVLEASHGGATFFARKDAGPALGRLLDGLEIAGPVDLVVGSANGTFVDLAEKAAVEDWLGPVNFWLPKPSFGEAFGAGALMQVVAAGMALRRDASVHRVLVTTIGLNQQAGGLVLAAE